MSTDAPLIRYEYESAVTFANTGAIHSYRYLIKRKIKMRYTFLLYTDPADLAHMTPEDWQAEKQVYGAYIGALKEAGVFLDADWLQPVDTATTITLKEGATNVQDGPFAETKETLGGFFAIEAPDLDAALVWAEKCPAAKTGKVEIRASAMGSV